MIKDFKSSTKAREALAEGMQEVCRLLSVTFGPFGNNVIMDDEKGNLLLSAQTNSVLRNLRSKDLFVNEGIEMAKEAALNTERLTGDGSVMTLLFINEMIDMGKRLIAAGVNPVIMARGLKKALPVITDEINKMAEPFTDYNLRKMLEYELKDDELTDIVVRAHENVGNDGTIIVKEGHGLKTELEFTEGFEVANGYLSDEMIIDLKSGIKTMHQPYILITDQVISSFSVLLPVLEQIVDAKAELLIVAEDVQGEALTLLINNNKKRIFKVVAVRAPGIGRRKADLLQDLATFTGGCVLNNENPVTLDHIKLKELGRVSEVRIERARTFFLGGNGDKKIITDRVRQIKEMIELNETEFMNKDQYRERIGNLEGKIAVIRVGAPTLLQMHEETHRIQSALAFIRATSSGGVLAGGGSTLAAISDLLINSNLNNITGRSAEENGKYILYEALKAPAKAFLSKEGLGVKEAIKIMSDTKGEVGYNAVTREFANMKEAGIYDASEVVITALSQAVSVIYEWLCTEVLMISVSPDQEDIALIKQGVPIMR